jgi:hypothetical protein
MGTSQVREIIASHVSKARIYSSHEHISSIDSFGKNSTPWFPVDIKPALPPSSATTLLDLLFSPYTTPQLTAMGATYPPDAAFKDDEAFLKEMEILRPIIKSNSGIGVLVCLDRGLKALHGIGLNEALSSSNGDLLLKLNTSIKDKYSHYFQWFTEVMEKSGTDSILKPVHPEFFLDRSFEKSAGELKYSVPIMRVDSLVGFQHNEKILDFAGVERAAGFEIKSASNLDEMITWFFGICDKFQVCSLKQLQAYSRPISVSDCTREEMSKALEVLLAARGAGTLAKYRDEALIVQNYILRRILEEADIRSLPYQIHTGMTILSQSNPGQLESMIQQYRNISFVILHAYPFISEATYLARTNPNVWVDTSWLVLQSPEILQIALKEYIGMVPADRIFSSIDSISLEEYAGGIALTRSILIDVLSEKVEKNFLDIEEALYISERVLGGNCKQLHRL